MELTKTLIDHSIKALYDLDRGSSLSLAMWGELLSYLLWLGVGQQYINRYTVDLTLRTRQAHPGLNATIDLRDLDSKIEILRTFVKLKVVDVEPIVERICKDIEKLAIVSDEWPVTAQSICDQLRLAGSPTSGEDEEPPRLAVKAFYEERYPKMLARFERGLSRAVGRQVPEMQLAIDRLKAKTPEWVYEHRTRSANELRDILLRG